MEGVADRLKTKASPYCCHAQFGRSSLKSVLIDRVRTPEIGERLGLGRGRPLKNKPQGRI